MACTVTISTVHGVVSPGATNPDKLQITGILTNCPSGVVVTAKDSVGTIIAGPSMPTPAANQITGGWGLILPITQPNVALGSAITVTAECSNGLCYDTKTIMALPGCEFVPGIVVSGLVPPGALAPVAVAVSGTSFGCPGGQLTIFVTDSAGHVIRAGPGNLHRTISGVSA